MYSVVLVMALAGSAETPDCHRCHGGGYGGCYGGGCYGGGYGGCYGGGYGGCYGGGYGGCYGGGYGGCYGGGYGGCYGGGYGGCGGGGYGGCGGIYYGGGMPYYGGKTGEPLKTMPKETGKESISAPANIVVNLPAGAKLTIDGYTSTQTTSTRYLVTPTLQPGQSYTYTLVAEVSQNGQPVQQSQVVTVRAGQTTPVSFDFNSVPVSTSR
jgi:uncharacterized protein (TIGR03000 family)